MLWLYLLGAGLLLLIAALVIFEGYRHYRRTGLQASQEPPLVPAWLWILLGVGAFLVIAGMLVAVFYRRKPRRVTSSLDYLDSAIPVDESPDS